MRYELREHEGKRLRIRGYVSTVSKVVGSSKKKTVCVANICDAKTGQFITSHQWFYYCDFNLNLEKGDVVEFTALVKFYLKGYKSLRKPADRNGSKLMADYRFCYPRSTRILT